MRQAHAASFRSYTLVAENGIAVKSQSVALILSNSRLCYNRRCKTFLLFIFVTFFLHFNVINSIACAIVAICHRYA